MFSSFKKLRRKSEPASNTTNDLNLTKINTKASTGSSSRHKKAKSLTKRLSIFSSNNSSFDDLNSIDSSYSNEVSSELTRFKSLNYDKFDKQVLRYLKFQGLSNPKILDDSNFIRISISYSGESIFLPSLVNYSEEECEDLDLHNSNNQNTSTNHRADDPRTDQDITATEINTNTTLHDETLFQNHIDDSVEPVSHTFAIIVSLYKTTPIATITTQLQTVTKIQWNKGTPFDKSMKSESFEIGQATWDLNLKNYNFFVPLKSSDSAIDDETNDSQYSNDSEDEDDTDVEAFLTEQKIDTKVYQLKYLDQITRGGYTHEKKDQDPFIIGNLNKVSNSVSFPPGDYVFLLPVLFPTQIPESLLTEKASVTHNLRTIVTQKGSKAYNYGNEIINIIRGPPVTGITTADKPIFVNKIWSDSLNYEISFPKKYIPIGSEIPIKLKLAPLQKNVFVKRIKINILERATYSSKDLRYEYDDQPVDETTPAHASVPNEKVISLVEIRTKQRVSGSIRDETIEENLFSDNLLACCYKSENDQHTDIIGSLKVSTYLPFVKPQKSLKSFPGSSKNPLVNLVIHTEKNNPQVTKQFKTRVINQDIKVPTVTHINHFQEGLYPDSSNNRHVSISHKLQISLRVSKKVQQGGTLKQHNYEVMIDTPIYLLNSACISDNVDLPAYEITVEDDKRLPTFEESITPLNSPNIPPTSIPFISGENTIQLLSRTSTITSGDPLSSEFGNIDHIVDASLSSFSLNDRRPSIARSEIMNTFKRTVTNVENEESSDDAAVGEPPKYDEVVPLMSDEESSLSSDDDSRVRYLVNGLTEESIDLTEQLQELNFR